MRTSSSSTRSGGVSRLLAVLVALTVFVLPAVAFSADAVVATVPVGADPCAVAVDPVSHRVFVANYGSDSVSIIDGATDSVAATVSIPLPPATAAAFPIAAVADPLTGRAYVGNFWCNTVSVIDGATMSRIATISPPQSHGSGVRALALDNAGATTKVYAAIYGKATVSVIDASTNAITKNIPVGGSPRGLAVFASGSRHRVYVANRATNDVSVIDGVTDSVVATVATGAAPRVIAVDPDRGFAYVSSPTSDTVTVIDAGDAATATIDVGDNPLGIGVDTARRRVFVANYNSNNVSVIDADTLSVVATIPTGVNPYAVAVDQSAGKVFVSCYGNGYVTIIDSTLAATPLFVGWQPYALAVDEGLAAHKTFVANWGSDAVHVIDPAEGSGGPVTVTVDPFPANTTTTSPVITGSATSGRTPFGSAIVAVFYRLDGEAAWRRAEIVDGQGTVSVRWQAKPGALAPGPHTIRVAAMDQAMTAASSADYGASGVSAALGTPSAYAFSAVPLAQQSDPRIAYTGSWTDVAGSGSGGSLRYTSSWGASATVAFTGTSCTLLGFTGPSYGIARVSVDGGAAEFVDFYRTGYGPQPVWTSATLAAGPHTVEIGYAGSRNASATASRISLDAVDVAGTLTTAPSYSVRYQQSDACIAYTGSWVDVTGSGSGGSLRYTASLGASASVAFTGTSCTLQGFTGPTYGIARVSVDGAASEAVDFYRTAYGTQPVWSSPALASGPHTVEIGYANTRDASSSGNRISLDAVDVAGTLTTAPAFPVRYEQSDTRIAYTTGWVDVAGSGSGGSLRYTYSLGASATVAFTGTGISLIGFTGPTYGIARVSVDGGAPELVDFYRTAYGSVPVWTSAPLANGSHTIEIGYTGLLTAPSPWARISLDAVDVRGVLTSASLVPPLLNA